MRLSIAVASAAFFLGSATFAQSPAEALKGTWAVESAYCGRSIYRIDGVDTKGIVHGTFTCVNTGWTATLGDKVAADAVKATLTGNHFVMVNADGGGTDVMLNGDKLEGTGKVKAESKPGRVVFKRE